MSKTAKELLLEKRPKPIFSKESAVSTGSTLLNLACSDQPDFAFLKGGYYFLVGDSRAGKTWIVHSTLAEASINPAFDKYDLIYDDVEGGAHMDVEFYFGKKLAERIQSPSMHKGKKVNSSTVESFYFHLWDRIKKGKPFIYALDSQDGLSSDSSMAKFEEIKTAFEKGKEAAGSYGDGKAKKHSEWLRQMISRMRQTGSILLIIGQTRDNLGFGFDKKTRSGGKALRFYANVEIWTSVIGSIKKKVRGKEREIGDVVEAFAKKNRVSGKAGKNRAVKLPILHGLGIDDIGACVDYLIEEEYWAPVSGEKKKARFNAEELFIEGTRDQIVAHVEEEGLENKLRKITAKLWAEIEEECAPTNRKKRYE